LIGGAWSGQIGQAIGGDGLAVVAVGGVDPEPTLGASAEALLTLAPSRIAQLSSP